jgi:RES domain
LGAPPREITPSGRMNVEFIPALYAAFSEYAAVAEIRPGIGDEVAIGEFLVRREIKVFDFTVFSKAEESDRKQSYEHTRFDFITQLEDEISKPISTSARRREYIPTQIVAEYLKEYFDCDAVIYKSSMTNNSAHDNRNIVILNKGTEFVGKTDAYILKLSNYTTKTIKDVAYSFLPSLDSLL